MTNNQKKHIRVLNTNQISNADVEIVPDNESEMIKLISDLTGDLQKKRKNNFLAQKGEVLRGVHPKSHGCVDAIFTINDDLSDEHKIGLFSHPGTYDTKIRYSNAQVLNLPDLEGGENGSRGMAIKVLGINKNLGPVLLEDNGTRSQDFLMVNTPEFAFANVRDYLRLTKILMEDKFGENAKPFFLPAVLFGAGLFSSDLELAPLNGDEPAEVQKAWQIYSAVDAFKIFNKEDLDGALLSARAVLNITNETVRNPTEVQYFTASPFRFGPEKIAKFSILPSTGKKFQKPFTKDEIKTLSPEYLAQALADTLKPPCEPIQLSFMVQVINASKLEGRKQTLVENAAQAWDKEEFPFVEVAKIVVNPVTAAQAENLVDKCKSQRFTPWHCLAEHEPIGGINRLRKPVYKDSADFRLTGKRNKRNFPKSEPG